MKVVLIFRKKIDKWLDKIKILKDRQTIIELEVLIQILEAQFREVVNIIFIIYPYNLKNTRNDDLSNISFKRSI